MRQLTTLDAQFLAVESARIYGHVAFLGIYDPSTAPGGRLDAERGQAAAARAAAPAAAAALAAGRGAARASTCPTGPRTPTSTSTSTCARPRSRRPGDDRQLAETVARVFGRPLDRGRPLWELYVIHGLTDGRVALLTKIHHSVVDGISGNEIMATLLDPEPTGPRARPPAGAAAAGAADPARPRDARARPARPPAPAAARAALAADDRRRLHRPAGRQRAARRADALARLLARPPALGSDENAGVLEVTKARPPKTPFNGPVSAHRRFAFGSLSLDSVRADPARVRHDRQRRRRGDLRRRGARLAARARRAAGRPAGGDDPDVGPQARRARHLGQPDLDDDRPDPDQRARPGRAPAAHPRAAAQRQGAPQRAARLAC